MNTLAAIHVAKKQLGLDDDTYRAMLARLTGKQSTKLMSENERLKVIETLRKHGFKKASKPCQKRLEGKFAKKLQALWIAAWNLGIVKNRTDEALMSFIKRQTGIDHARFLHYGDDAGKVIEALKRWLARDGGIDWCVDKMSAGYEQSNGYKIAVAQFEKLNRSSRFFWQDVFEIIGEVTPEKITDKQWQMAMNAFGKRIRKAKRDGCL